MENYLFLSGLLVLGLWSALLFVWIKIYKQTQPKEWMQYYEVMTDKDWELLKFQHRVARAMITLAVIFLCYGLVSLIIS